MIKKIVSLLLPLIILSACNALGPKRVKNIVELTPKLSLQSNEPIYFTPFFFKFSYIRNNLLNGVMFGLGIDKT
jgi:hypothetical protein